MSDFIEDDHMDHNMYDEIEIEDMDFEDGIFTYLCPCGDKFQITVDQLKSGKTIAMCPSCPLIIEIIFEIDSIDELVSDLEG